MRVCLARVRRFLALPGTPHWRPGAGGQADRDADCARLPRALRSQNGVVDVVRACVRGWTETRSNGPASGGATVRSARVHATLSARSRHEAAARRRATPGQSACVRAFTASRVGRSPRRQASDLGPDNPVGVAAEELVAAAVPVVPELPLPLHLSRDGAARCSARIIYLRVPLLPSVEGCAIEARWDAELPVRVLVDREGVGDLADEAVACAGAEREEPPVARCRLR